MVGEIGLKVDKCNLSDHSVRPYGEYNKRAIDFTLKDASGEFFHICGNNDWGYLLADAMLPIFSAGLKIFEDVNNQLNEYTGLPEVIVLGKNDFRVADIVHRMRGDGDALTMYKGVPVVCGIHIDGIQLHGKQIDKYCGLPFA